MSNNSNLHKAKKARNDEFYTMLSDIENELRHYRDHFKGKVVYCNCDDARESNFFKYFSMNFEFLGLKKLISTGYKKDGRGVKLVYDGDRNGNRTVDDEEVQVAELEGDGDFRSEECVELLKQADIVVSNPPFSLFREYVAQLVKYDKKFLIIGQTNAITFKEIFPLIKANRLWLGYGFKGGNSYFRIPKGRVDEYDESFCDREKCIVHFRNCSWFTNMDHGKRHEKLILTEKYDPAKYPKFDNYDAINVDKVKDIPKDWDGVMGVPITFLDKYNPEQFEIVQFRKGEDGKDLAFTVARERELCRTSGCSYEEFEKKFPLTKCIAAGMLKSGEGRINGKAIYARILIERKKPVGENGKTPAA